MVAAGPHPHSWVPFVLLSIIRRHVWRVRCACAACFRHSPRHEPSDAFDRRSYFGQTHHQSPTKCVKKAFRAHVISKRIVEQCVVSTVSLPDSLRFCSCPAQEYCRWTSSTSCSSSVLHASCGAPPALPPSLPFLSAPSSSYPARQCCSSQPLSLPSRCIPQPCTVPAPTPLRSRREIDHHK